MKKIVVIGLLSITFAVLSPPSSVAEPPQKPRKETERVIWKYETLINSGALLSLQGWSRANTLFRRSVPYPTNSPIKIVWMSRFIGEDWVKGDKAQVESKWSDYYGTIDSKLRYQPPEIECAMMNGYELTRTDTTVEVDANGTEREVKGTMTWKLVGPNVRAGTIEHVIAYLRQARERTKDREVKRNATRSIAALQRLRIDIRRPSASAC